MASPTDVAAAVSEKVPDPDVFMAQIGPIASFAFGVLCLAAFLFYKLAQMWMKSRPKQADTGSNERRRGNDDIIGVLKDLLAEQKLTTQAHGSAHEALMVQFKNAHDDSGRLAVGHRDLVQGQSNILDKLQHLPTPMTTEPTA